MASPMHAAVDLDRDADAAAPAWLWLVVVLGLAGWLCFWPEARAWAAGHAVEVAWCLVLLVWGVRRWWAGGLGA